MHIFFVLILNFQVLMKNFFSFFSLIFLIFSQTMAGYQTNYNCRQAELYTACEMGWNACAAKITDFGVFSPIYSSVLVDQRLTEISDARNLPDYQARNAVAEAARQTLIVVNSDALNIWQRLKRYIEYAVPPTDTQSQWDAAGLGYYQEASNLNWDSTAQMLTSAVNYIAANQATLTSGNNMPTTFPAMMDSIKLRFDQSHTDFLTKRQDAEVATEEKVTANNQIYTDTIAMFADARLLGFSPAEMKRFTFSELLRVISGSGSGSSGISGIVKDVSGVPIANANVEIVNTGAATVTDAAGAYSFSGLASGTYNIVISATGYQQVTASVTLSPNGSAIFNSTMHV